jgi:biotin carboxyl carrier protein
MVTPAWTVTRRDDGRLDVRQGDRHFVADAVVDEDVAWIWIDGYLLALPVGSAARRRAGGAGADAAALTPQMSAKVIRVNVSPGQAVAAGDALIVLEAMKMEMPIRAPRDGAIKSVSCAEGDLVQPGQPLVEYGADE